MSVTGLLNRLCAAQLADGAWAYHDGGAVAPEPTSLACVALSAHRDLWDALGKGLSALRRLQRPDGAVPAIAAVSVSTWPTALSALAWQGGERVGVNGHKAAIDNAAAWLLELEGQTFTSDPHVYGHDTHKIGWPWIDGTHTWLEPTAYALLALRAAGLNNRPRYKAGIDVLLDRAIESGGWNYGNGRMFGADLRPFPETSGIALAALAAQPSNKAVELGLRYLYASVDTAPSAMALAWAVIGLDAWGRRPADAMPRLDAAADRAMQGPCRPARDALLLIAASDPCTLNSIAARRELVEAGSV